MSNQQINLDHLGVTIEVEREQRIIFKEGVGTSGSSYSFCVYRCSQVRVSESDDPDEIIFSFKPHQTLKKEAFLVGLEKIKKSSSYVLEIGGLVFDQFRRKGLIKKNGACI
jgi:hypothetical protein